VDELRAGKLPGAWNLPTKFGRRADAARSKMPPRLTLFAIHMVRLFF
jgi:hypothetical protein